jgi:hypothetical protein
MIYRNSTALNLNKLTGIILDNKLQKIFGFNFNFIVHISRIRNTFKSRTNQNTNETCAMCIAVTILDISIILSFI